MRGLCTTLTAKPPSDRYAAIAIFRCQLICGGYVPEADVGTGLTSLGFSSPRLSTPKDSMRGKAT